MRFQEPGGVDMLMVGNLWALKATFKKGACTCAKVDLSLE